MNAESKNTWATIIGYVITCALLIVILKCCGAV
jgi:hypothetical protein